jgi:hypothetical protein
MAEFILYQISLIPEVSFFLTPKAAKAAKEGARDDSPKPGQMLDFV